MAILYSYTGASSSELADYPEWPAGVFNVYIDKMVDSLSKSGRPYINMHLKPADEEQKKYGTLFRRIMLDTDYTRIDAGRLIKATGGDPEQAADIDWERFVGEHIRVKITYKEKDGNRFQNVLLLPPDEDAPKTPPPGTLQDRMNAVPEPPPMKPEDIPF